MICIYIYTDILQDTRYFPYEFTGHLLFDRGNTLASWNIMGYMASNYHVLGVSENEDCLPNLVPSEERENDDRTKSLGKLFCWVPNFRTNQYLVDGIPTPLKNDGLRQLGPDDIPNWMESHKIPWFQTTNQMYSNDDPHHYIIIINHHYIIIII